MIIFTSVQGHRHFFFFFYSSFLFFLFILRDTHQPITELCPPNRHTISNFGNANCHLCILYKDAFYFKGTSSSILSSYLETTRCSRVAPSWGLPLCNRWIFSNFVETGRFSFPCLQQWSWFPLHAVDHRVYCWQQTELPLTSRMVWKLQVH